MFSRDGKTIGKGTQTQGRVYAPSVVADIDADGTLDVVVGGNQGTVAAYELKSGALSSKWTASTCSATECPEARGMAAADLDGDGKIEIAVTTTNTQKTGSQVFVFNSEGQLYDPSGALEDLGHTNLALGTVVGEPAEVEKVA